MSSPYDILKIDCSRVDEINMLLTDTDNPLINSIFEIIDKYGGVKEINKRAEESRSLDNLLQRIEKSYPNRLRDIEWLMKMRDQGSFISMTEYRKKILGSKLQTYKLDEEYAVTLEISACNFFPWLIEEARMAIKKQDLMPGRYIIVRSLKEQVEDGDILAFPAAMQIIGASFVQTLDTKGTLPGPDGKPINIHLGGPDTITGYFGGVGVPNEYALRWVDELLFYYTNYGVSEVLNINNGTVLLGYILYKLGIDIKFKISVYLGNDNPYNALWTLMTAKLFSREDGSTPLSGFNLSNSVNNDTILKVAYIRKVLGLEDKVRIEHHITESYIGIVRQPYDRLKDLLEIAGKVKNISVKHEGAPPDVEKKRKHPSNILEYFISKEEIIKKGLMPKLLVNYLDKHDSVNRTAKALIEKVVPVIAARYLH